MRSVRRQPEFSSLHQPTIPWPIFTLLLALAVQPVQAQHYKIIYAFTDPDHLSAGSSLARDGFGNLYGASTSASLLQCTQGACGAIYKVDPTGHASTLYAFTGPPDAAGPLAVTLAPAVSVDAAGILYGTTQYGGTSNFPYCNGAGCGTVFKLTTTGQETVLHSFSQPPGDGIIPQAGDCRFQR